MKEEINSHVAKTKIIFKIEYFCTFFLLHCELVSIFSQISSVILRHVYGWETVVLSLTKMALKTMHVGADYLWLQLLRYVNG